MTLHPRSAACEGRRPSFWVGGLQGGRGRHGRNQTAGARPADLTETRDPAFTLEATSLEVAGRAAGQSRGATASVSGHPGGKGALTPRGGREAARSVVVLPGPSAILPGRFIRSSWRRWDARFLIRPLGNGGQPVEARQFVVCGVRRTLMVSSARTSPDWISPPWRPRAYPRSPAGSQDTDAATAARHPVSARLALNERQSQTRQPGCFVACGPCRDAHRTRMSDG